jgi:predicted protein tyrosine phosphatase
MAKTLGEVGYNTRSCGIVEEYALIPLSHALLAWADVILCAEQWQKRAVLEEAERFGITAKVISLDIPDEYKYNHPTLVKLIKDKWDELIGEGIVK